MNINFWFVNCYTIVRFFFIKCIITLVYQKLPKIKIAVHMFLKISETFIIFFLRISICFNKFSGAIYFSFYHILFSFYPFYHIFDIQASIYYIHKSCLQNYKNNFHYYNKIMIRKAYMLNIYKFLICRDDVHRFNLLCMPELMFLISNP